MLCKFLISLLGVESAGFLVLDSKTLPLAVLENLDIQYPEGASVIIRRMAVRLCENLVAVPDGDI